MFLKSAKRNLLRVNLSLCILQTLREVDTYTDTALSVRATWPVYPPVRKAISVSSLEKPQKVVGLNLRAMFINQYRFFNSGIALIVADAYTKRCTMEPGQKKETPDS